MTIANSNTIGNGKNIVSTFTLANSNTIAIGNAKNTVNTAYLRRERKGIQNTIPTAKPKA